MISYAERENAVAELIEFPIAPGSRLLMALAAFREQKNDPEYLAYLESCGVQSDQIPKLETTWKNP